MEIIGHRGARGLAPENSLQAIRRGLAAKVDMIEVDLRVKNNEIVLSHDPVIHSEKYASLEDALTTINSRVPINLEIKELDVIPLLKKELLNYKGKILFSSFEFRILQALKKEFPKADLAVLEKWSGVRAVAEATLLGTDRVHINQQWLWSGFVKSMKHRGFKLYAYTVNSRDRAEELEEWGIDGIFTDYPSLF
ncbi:MAG: glycerophosphodiester phosphodiesterase, partial [Candidatus Saccharibacteria bacterium]|nr:glycerophosphodiester phosphodiesterase [Candidatus Saccharibacteria bacterium]